MASLTTKLSALTTLASLVSARAYIETRNERNRDTFTSARKSNRPLFAASGVSGSGRTYSGPFLSYSHQNIEVPVPCPLRQVG